MMLSASNSVGKISVRSFDLAQLDQKLIVYVKIRCKYPIKTDNYCDYHHFHAAVTAFPVLKFFRILKYLHLSYLMIWEFQNTCKKYDWVMAWKNTINYPHIGLFSENYLFHHCFNEVSNYGIWKSCYFFLKQWRGLSLLGKVQQDVCHFVVA